MDDDNFVIDDIIKNNSISGMNDEERFRFRLMIDTTNPSKDYCRICESHNDPQKSKALQNSTLCYQHIRLCMAYGKYLQ